MRVLPLLALLVLAGCARPAPSPSASGNGIVVTETESPTASAPSAAASTTASASNSTSTSAPPALPAGAVAPNDESTRADVRAANGFALGLYGRAKRASGNLCVSGTSLRYALGVAYLGARGDTAKELAKALALPAPEVATGLGAQEMEDWKKAKPEGGALTIATRLWVDDAVTLAPSFTGLVAAYGAPAEHLPIAADPERARTTVNGWVDERTNGKIPELLAKGAVDARARMLVTNAVHLKASWAEPFPKDATKDETFRVDGRTPATVPMMHLVGSLRHATFDTHDLVELRYDGTPIAMTLAVPKDATGLARVEQALGVETLETWTKALAQRKVSLALPRFTFTAGGSMNDVLRDMGVRTAFGDRADFGGMVDEARKDKERFAIDQVVQRTFVAVDELGTEAAAATGVVMRTTSLDLSKPVEVKADKPFVFVLRDVTRGRVLFVGRVTDPRPKG